MTTNTTQLAVDFAIILRGRSDPNELGRVPPPPLSLALPVPIHKQPKRKNRPNGIGPASRTGISATKFLLPRCLTVGSVVSGSSLPSVTKSLKNDLTVREHLKTIQSDGGKARCKAHHRGAERPGAQDSSSALGPRGPTRLSPATTFSAKPSKRAARRLPRHKYRGASAPRAFAQAHRRAVAPF